MVNEAFSDFKGIKANPFSLPVKDDVLKLKLFGRTTFSIKL